MNQEARLGPRPEAFARWLEPLPCRIGEVVITRGRDGAFELCHRDDADRDDLSVQTTADDAAEIARYDDTGRYRPLKTAPNLRHGWKLRLRDVAEVRLGLDLIYPGRIGTLLAFDAGTLITTPLRETLKRQTGMYRVAGRISDEEADKLVSSFCRSDRGCLRTILWRRDAAGVNASTLLPPAKFDPEHDQTGRGERAVPLLCQEACNLLVAAARNVVKSAAE